MNKNLYNILKAAFILPFLMFLGVQNGYCQLTVTSGVSAATLASTLAGAGVTILSPTLTCPTVAEGTFTATGTPLSMSSGIILTNGHASACAGPEGALVSFNDGAPGDPALAPFLPAGTTIVDACYLEFDIVPKSDTLSFNYQFGSEEYRNAVCSIYTDVFAFFISGPGIVGTVNMATVPGTTIPVEINSVNNGGLGTVGGAAHVHCTSLGAGSPFTMYYIDNTGGSFMSYRGYTTKFTASHVVTPCDTYHLKLSIVDAGNALYDSGVFLEGGSLKSGSFHFDHFDSVGTTIEGIPHSIVKGCNSATVEVLSTTVLTTAETLHFSFGGSAVQGTDFTAPDSTIMPAGDTSITFNVSGIPTTIGGTKTLTIYLSGACGIIDSVNLNILDTPTAMILTPDTSICGTSVLIRTTGTAGLTYAWTPPTGLSSTTVPSPTATPASTTTYTMTATLPGSGCPPIVRSITISVGSVGVTMLTPDTTICAIGDSVHLRVGGLSTLVYSWSPTLGLSNPSIQNPTATPSVTTTYTVTASAPGTGCGSATAHVTITVVNPMDSLLTHDTTICSGESFTIRDMGTTGMTYSWTPSTGLSSTTIPNPVASPLVTTDYILTATLAGCPAIVRSVLVTVNNTVISMITPDTTVCLMGTPVNMRVAGSNTLNYSWSPTIGLSNPYIQNPVATPSVTTTYTVTATAAGGLCPARAVVTITVLNITPIGMLTPDTTICLGDSLMLRVIDSSAGLTYSWTPTSGLNTPSTQDPIATPTITTTYTVNAAGPGGACASNAAVTVTVNQVWIGMISPDTSICVGDKAHIFVNGDPSYIYNWLPPTGLSDSATMDPIASPASTTIYTVMATNPVNGCIAEATIKIGVGKPLLAWIINPTLTYCQNMPADSLSKDVYLYGTNLLWYSVYKDTIGTPISPIPTTSNVGTYYYYVSQLDGNCNSGKGTITVDVIMCCDGPIFIPTSFTPNKDGLNDFFRIIRPPHLAINEFKIFNRWGQLVFSGDNTNEKWDGTFEGQEAPMDVYFYTVTLSCADGGNEIRKTGDVTIIR